jgi:hypothetical protein
MASNDEVNAMGRNSVSLAVLLLLLPILAGAQTQPRPLPVILACRALETHTDPNSKIIVIVFHQRDVAQRAELAVLLRDHSGQSVEIQGADGGWHPARMFRLKSCFGRGLLMLAAPSPVAEHEQFLLRVPGGAAPPPPHS